MRRRRLILGGGLALCLTAAACAATFRSASMGDTAGSAEPASLYAPHGEVGGFFNPWAQRTVGWPQLLKWKLLSRNRFADEKARAPDVPRVENDGASLSGTEEGAAITWVGHATLAVHDGPDVFLTDPIFTDRAAVKKRHHPPGVPLSAVPPHAFAVVSHNHYDHLDADTVDGLPPTVGFYVPLGLAGWFRERGKEDVTELDWWQSARRGRWTVTCVPSQHWSRRFGHGENESLWCAWLLDSGERRYYFAGDTGYFHGFSEVGRRFGPVDVAMLPIGAYEPRWFMRGQHINPAEAWQAFRDLGARWLVPMHWGTFDLTDEPLDRPPVDLMAAVDAAGGDRSQVALLAIGERWRVPPGE